MKKLVLLSLIVLMFSYAFGKEVEKVPDFSLNALDGKAVSLSYYTSDKDVSFLVFFTTWCPWCSKQMETFEEMFQENSTKNQFLAIGFDNDVKKIKSKMKSLGITYPVVVGNNKIAGYFNVSGIPVTVVIDKSGKVTDQVVGFRDKKYFVNYLKQ
ncbi:MAG: TlpA disulfide reductase family protein [Candidatus Margulisbacteria bacterium]|nr:TlpA disulfide reductase family protein [Candidatus Margulisiibacteriota bacterium]